MSPGEPRIFVQIAAYRDPETLPTILDALARADHPERVSFGLCWQHMPGEDEALLPKDQLPEQVRLIDVHAGESEGVCWARSKIQSLYEGEDYALFIDSHMRFIPGWDSAMIAEQQRCPADKAVFSSYPASYTPPNDLDANPRQTIMRAHPYNEQGEIRFRAEFLTRAPDAPLNGAFIAAGYMFTPGSVIEEVPYDPYLYFNQEEITLAARLWTHGYDIFSPSRTMIYHFYNTAKAEVKRNMHWDDNPQWANMTRRGRKRFNHILEHEKTDDAEALRDIERYSLGTTRTLDEYQDYCGIDLRNKVVSEKALRCGFIKGLEKWKDRPIHIPQIDNAQ